MRESRKICGDTANGRRDRESENSMKERLAYEEQRRKRMEEMCRGYDNRPVQDISNKAASGFARKLARGAASSIGLSQEEAERYAGAVFGAICYFNRRSKRHAEVTRYIRECEEIRRRNEAAPAKEPDIVII